MIYPIAGLCLAVALFVAAEKFTSPGDKLRGLAYWPSIAVAAASIVAYAWILWPPLAFFPVAAFAFLIVGLVKGWFY